MDIAGRLDLGAEAVEPGTGLGDGELEGVVARLQLDILLDQQVAVREEAHLGRAAARALHGDEDIDRFALAGARRGPHLADQRLVARVGGEAARGDLDPRGGGGVGGGDEVALRLLAVGDQHQAAGIALREEREAEADRAREVAVAGLGFREERAEIGVLADRALDQRIVAEDDDPGAVALRHPAEGGADEVARGGRGARPDAVGGIDQEDRRQAVRLPHDRGPGQGEDRGGDEQQAHGRRRDPPPAHGALDPLEGDHRQDGQRQQAEQEERIIEAQTHAGLFFRLDRRGSQARARAARLPRPPPRPRPRQRSRPSVPSDRAPPR